MKCGGKNKAKYGRFTWQFAIFSTKIESFCHFSFDNSRYFHGILIPLYQIIINYSGMKKLNRIKVVLVEKGKTGKWLADKLEKTPCTVSKWCSNSIQPDLNTIDKIATLLNVDRRTLIETSEI